LDDLALLPNEANERRPLARSQIHWMLNRPRRLLSSSESHTVKI
jgi:hypothetical protein